MARQGVLGERGIGFILTRQRIPGEQGIGFVLARQGIPDERIGPSFNKFRMSGWMGDDGGGYGAAVGGVAAFGQGQIQPSQQIQSQKQIGAALFDLGGQGAQNPFLLPLLG